MTRAKISEYSATANDNTDVNGVNIAEGCPPSSMNNMGREIMAALKRFQVGSDGDGVTVGGSLVVSGSTTANTFSATNVSASGNLTFTGTGNRITGDFSNATVANRVAFQSSTGTFTSVPFYGPGASQSSSIDLILGNAPTDTSRFQMLSSTVDARLNAGIYGSGTYLPMTFYTGGLERLRIDTGGNVSINRTAGIGGSKFLVKSSTSNGSWATITVNTADLTMFGVLDNGGVVTGTAASSPYNNTTASAANMFVDSNGLLYRSTSSLKYKTDVQDATNGLAEVMQLRPVTYKGKNDGETVFGGLIAEEVHEAGLTEFVQYATDGTPDALHYGNMVSLCVKAIQELKAELDTVKAELATLKG